MNEQIYKHNISLLKKYTPNLLDLANANIKSEYEYIIDQAKNGSKTLSIKYNDKIYQIHSKYNPEREAEQQIEKSEMLSPNILVINGIGLAYHIKAALKKYDEDIKYLIIIEKDINAFKTAIENIDLEEVIKRPNLCWLIGVSENDSYNIAFSILQTYGISMQLYLKTITKRV